MINTLNPNVPDLEWLARISEEDFAKVKTRYAELIRFTSDTIVKEYARLALITEDETYKAELGMVILKDMAADISLPEAFRKQAQDELNEKLG